MMIDRLVSLRLWLLLAMLATAVVTLAAGNFIAQRLSAASDYAADYGKAMTTARAIAGQVRDGADADDLQALQKVLPSDQVVVKAGGRTVFAGPSMDGLPLELAVSVPVPGGAVELRDHHTPGSGGVAQATLIAGFIAAIVIAEAWLAATVLVRTVRRPVRRAIEAAGRLAEGDFSARMGASGPQEFARLGRAVDAMAAQLQRSDAEQKRFLADLAHEIATPVSAISGFALALSDGSARTVAERAEAADIMVQESGRLQRLLQDMRQLTQLDITGSVRTEQVDLRVLCTEMAQRFRLAARDAGITVSVRAARIVVTADPRLVDTVVGNFMSNAVRYTPEGGKVEIRARRRPAATVISVRDTGAGIASAHLERIFHRLYRADDARDRATGGSGLGLAIARGAAQSLGGRIEVDSQPGSGSEFRLILPAGPPALGDEKTAAQLPSGAGKPE